jgi:hypothetical protein
LHKYRHGAADNGIPPPAQLPPPVSSEALLAAFDNEEVATMYFTFPDSKGKKLFANRQILSKLSSYFSASTLHISWTGPADL